jgi:hypothetical protein
MCRATERKQEKAEAAWEKRLQTLREENEAAYKRQSDFCTKVSRHEDMKTLSLQCGLMLLNWCLI